MARYLVQPKIPKICKMLQMFGFYLKYELKYW